MVIAPQRFGAEHLKLRCYFAELMLQQHFVKLIQGCTQKLILILQFFFGCHIAKRFEGIDNNTPFQLKLFEVF
jgi:hypothetical protein